jgi:hypothetical protein
LLFFDGCPSYGPAVEVLRAALAGEGIDAAVNLVAVSTDEEARRLRFPGSPTIRFNGEDAFPVGGARGPAEWGLRCRVHATPEGLEGSPTAPMLRKAPRLALPVGKKPPTTS